LHRVKDSYSAENIVSEMDIDEGDLTRIIDKQTSLVIKGLGMIVKDQKILRNNADQSLLIKSSFMVGEYSAQDVGDPVNQPLNDTSNLLQSPYISQVDRGDNSLINSLSPPQRN
jgi:hypothetical protein